jgi:hypothetical protein
MGTGRCPGGKYMNPWIMTLVMIACICTLTMYACLAAISSKYSRVEEEEGLRMAAEKEFENKIKAYLKEQGCWYIKYWGGGGFTKSGIPDLLICCNGRFIAAEVKSSTGSPTDLQRKKIREIRDAGGIAFVLYPEHFETFKTMIQRIKEGKEC